MMTFNNLLMITLPSRRGGSPPSSFSCLISRKLYFCVFSGEATPAFSELNRLFPELTPTVMVRQRERVGHGCAGTWCFVCASELELRATSVVSLVHATWCWRGLGLAAGARKRQDTWRDFSHSLRGPRASLPWVPWEPCRRVSIRLGLFINRVYGSGCGGDGMHASSQRG